MSLSPAQCRARHRSIVPGTPPIGQSDSRSTNWRSSCTAPQGMLRREILFARGVSIPMSHLYQDSLIRTHGPNRAAVAKEHLGLTSIPCAADGSEGGGL